MVSGRVFWRVSRFGIGKFFVSGRTVCFYCSVVKSGKFCSRSRFRTDCGTVCTGIFDEIVFKRASCGSGMPDITAR